MLEGSPVGSCYVIRNSKGHMAHYQPEEEMATNIGYLRSKTKTTEHPVIIVKYFNFNLESRVVRQLVPMNFCSCSSIEMEHISEGWTDCVS